jgi:hypothetical protein
MPPGTWSLAADAEAGKMPIAEAMMAAIIIPAVSRTVRKRGFRCRLGSGLTLTPFAWAREVNGRRGVSALRRPCNVPYVEGKPASPHAG